MTNFAIMDRSGRLPLQLGAQSRVPDGAIILPDGIDVASYATKWRDPATGAWSERPAIAAPVVTRTDAGWVVAYAAPDGAVCAVVDRDLGFLDAVASTDGTLTFVLADAGPYQLEVTAPLPWLGRTDNLVLA